MTNKTVEERLAALEAAIFGLEAAVFGSTPTLPERVAKLEEELQDYSEDEVVDDGEDV